MKRIIVFILSVIIVLSSSVCAYADTPAADFAEESGAEKIETDIEGEAEGTPEKAEGVSENSPATDDQLTPEETEKNVSDNSISENTSFQNSVSENVKEDTPVSVNIVPENESRVVISDNSVSENNPDKGI